MKRTTQSLSVLTSMTGCNLFSCSIQFGHLTRERFLWLCDDFRENKLWCPNLTDVSNYIDQYIYMDLEQIQFTDTCIDSNHPSIATSRLCALRCMSSELQPKKQWQILWSQYNLYSRVTSQQLFVDIVFFLYFFIMRQSLYVHTCWTNISRLDSNPRCAHIFLGCGCIRTRIFRQSKRFHIVQHRHRKTSWSTLKTKVKQTTHELHDFPSVVHALSTFLYDLYFHAHEFFFERFICFF